MGLVCRRYTFEQPASTGTVRYTFEGLGAAPKMGMVWTNHFTGYPDGDDTIADSSFIVLGIFAGLQQAVVSGGSSDGNGTTKATRTQSDAAIIRSVSTATSSDLLLEASITDYGRTGNDGWIDVNWTSVLNDIDRYITFTVWTGSDIEEAKVVTNWTTPTSTGEQEYTGLGFRPTGAIAIGNGHADTPPGNTNTHQTAVHFISPSDVFAIISSDQDAVSTTDCLSSFHQQIVSGYSHTPGLVDAADWEGFTPDGWKVNWTDADSNVRYVHMLVFKGPQVKVGTVTLNDTLDKPGSVDIELGFDPETVMFLSNGSNSVDHTGLDDIPSRLSLGMVNKQGEQGVIMYASRNGVSTSDCIRWQRDDHVMAIRNISAGNWDVRARAKIDGSRVTLQAYDLDEADKDTPLSYMGYMAIGPKPQPRVTVHEIASPVDGETVDITVPGAGVVTGYYITCGNTIKNETRGTADDTANAYIRAFMMMGDMMTVDTLASGTYATNNNDRRHYNSDTNKITIHSGVNLLQSIDVSGIEDGIRFVEDGTGVSLHKRNWAVTLFWNCDCHVVGNIETATAPETFTTGFKPDLLLTGTVGVAAYDVGTSNALIAYGAAVRNGEQFFVGEGHAGYKLFIEDGYSVGQVHTSVNWKRAVDTWNDNGITTAVATSSTGNDVSTYMFVDTKGMEPRITTLEQTFSEDEQGVEYDVLPGYDVGATIGFLTSSEEGVITASGGATSIGSADRNAQSSSSRYWSSASNNREVDSNYGNAYLHRWTGETGASFFVAAIQVRKWLSNGFRLAVSYSKGKKGTSYNLTTRHLTFKKTWND